MTTLGTFWEGLILMALGIAMAVITALYPTTDLKTYATLVLGAGWGYITGGAAPNGTSPPTTITKIAAVLALVMITMFSLSGCATIDMTCPAVGTQTISIGGSTIGNQLVTLASTAGMAAAGLPPIMGASKNSATPTGAHVHYSYLPIFGADSVSCSYVAPPASPLPVAIVSQVPAK